MMGSKGKHEKKKKGGHQAPRAATPYSPITKAQLVTFGERATYTFVYGREVGSIHYDHGRAEIFFKGHNIRYMDLENWQMQMLEKTRAILKADAKTKIFADDYGRTLDKIIFEKSKTPRSSP